MRAVSVPHVWLKRPFSLHVNSGEPFILNRRSGRVNAAGACVGAGGSHLSAIRVCAVSSMPLRDVVTAILSAIFTPSGNEYVSTY